MELDDGARGREAVPGQAVTMSCDPSGTLGTSQLENRASMDILFAACLATSKL